LLLLLLVLLLELIEERAARTYNKEKRIVLVFGRSKQRFKIQDTFYFVVSSKSSVFKSRLSQHEGSRKSEALVFEGAAG
jgi:hypothetical protein